MANYKYQHYLPVGHQKLFSTDPRGFLCKYDKGKSILYSALQNPKNHGGKNHLYSYPDDLVLTKEQKTYLEQNYFSHDGEFVRVVNSLISNSGVNEKDVYQITKYIANINNRHPGILKSREKDVTQSALEHMFGNDSKLIEWMKLEGIKFIPKSEADFVKISSLSDMLASIVANLHELCDISMNILVSDGAEFILSDAPFVGVNDECDLISTNMLSCEMNYFLPLSKSICVHLHGEGQNLNSYSIDNERVELINRLQLSSAKEFVVGSSIDVLQKNLDISNLNYEIK